MDYTESEEIALEKNGDDPNGYENEYEGKKFVIFSITVPPIFKVKPFAH